MWVLQNTPTTKAAKATKAQASPSPDKTSTTNNNSTIRHMCDSWGT